MNVFMMFSLQIGLVHGLNNYFQNKKNLINNKQMSENLFEK